VKNFRLVLEYDGTDFLGWQIQPRGRTIQGVLESTLQQLLQQRVRLIGAGRTDAGVHALGQVANFHAETRLSPSTIRSGLNSLSPGDIQVRGLAEVSPDFHARFDARSRTYTYRIRPVFSPLRRRFAWTVTYPLNWNAVVEAAAQFVGDKDFRSFGSLPNEGGSSRCQVFGAVWSRDGDEMVLEIEADRFLSHMVRAIVGTLVDVGRGRITPNSIPDIIAAQDRRKAGPAAPAHGLCLVRVRYD